MAELVRADAHAGELHGRINAREPEKIRQPRVAIFKPRTIRARGPRVVVRPALDARAQNRVAGFQFVDFLHATSRRDVGVEAPIQFGPGSGVNAARRFSP